MPCKPKQGNAFENRNSRARAHGFNSKLFLKALNVRAERRALWKTHGAAYCPPTLLPPCSRPVAFGDGLGRASCPPEATAKTIGAACRRQVYLSARRFLAPNRHNSTPKHCKSQSGFSGKEVRGLKGCGSKTLYAACRTHRNQKRHRPLPSRLDRAWRATDSGVSAFAVQGQQGFAQKPAIWLFVPITPTPHRRPSRADDAWRWPRCRLT